MSESTPFPPKYLKEFQSYLSFWKQHVEPLARGVPDGEVPGAPGLAHHLRHEGVADDLSVIVPPNYEHFVVHLRMMPSEERANFLRDLATPEVPTLVLFKPFIVELECVGNYEEIDGEGIDPLSAEVALKYRLMRYSSWMCLDNTHVDKTHVDTVVKGRDQEAPRQR